MLHCLLAQATNPAPLPTAASEAWYTQSVYLLTGFLLLGLLVVGTILVVLWRTRIKDR